MNHVYIVMHTYFVEHEDGYQGSTQSDIVNVYDSREKALARIERIENDPVEQAENEKYGIHTLYHTVSERIVF